MNMKEMLLDSREIEAYDLELRSLGKLKIHTENEYGSFCLIFLERPNYQLPEKIFLMPYSDEGSFISYLCTLSGELVERRDVVSKELYYTMEGFNQEAETLRDELRVYTSFPARVFLEGRRDGIEVEVKDISVGGIMFVSKKKIEVGENFSFAFVSGKKEIMVQAVIKVQRPVHVSGMYGYGCKLSYLSSHDEAEIRSFVFREDIKRHHHK